MARQLIKPGDNDRLINAKVAANLIEIGLLSTHQDRRPDFVRSPRAAATILDEQLAGIAGPKFTGSARNFRSFAREANERFAAAYDSLGLIAETLFSSDTYKLADVSKDFADCYNVSSASVGTGASFGRIGGEGYVLDFHGGGAATSASASLTATAELAAVLNMELGFSGVIDVTPVFSDPSEAIYLGANVYLPGPQNQIDFMIRDNGSSGNCIAIYDATNYPTNQTIVVVPEIVSGKKYRLAFSFKPDLTLLSVDGAATVSHVPNVVKNYATGIFKTYNGIFSARPGSKLILGDHRFRRFVADHSLLQRMSG